MNVTDAWLDVEDIELADASDVTFDLSLGAYDFLVEETVRTGAWWVRPFARDASRNLFGVRLAPGVACREGPVVLVPEGSPEARTVASRPAFFVPLHLWRWLPREWDAARALEPGGWAQLARLHRALGGQGALEELRAVVRDEELREAVTSADRLTNQERRRRMDEVAARLDRGPGTSAFFAYLGAMTREDGGLNAPVPWPDVGPWTASLAALALRANEARPQAAAHAAWELLNQPPGLDSGHAEHGPAELAPSGGLRLAVAAAQAAAREPAPAWRADALWPAVEALAAAGEAYDGARHLEAADALERRGDAGRAFVALTAAAYFSHHATGAASPESLDAAIALARRHGPEPLLEHLERVESCRAAAELTDLRRSVVSSIAAMMTEQAAPPATHTPVTESPVRKKRVAKKTPASRKKAAKKTKKKKVVARKKPAARPKRRTGAR